MTLPHCAGETSKQASDVLDSPCPELPFRQPSYYYKLRNFYSKHYYKQAAGPGHDRTAEQPRAFRTAADLGASDSQPCPSSHPECVLESSEHLPPHFLAPPLSDSAPDPELDSLCQPPTRQLRLKKAIHLKKLNFLKSQKSAERPSDAKPDDSLTKRVECAGANTTEKASSHGAEENEGEDLVHAEHFNCINETERPEEAAALEDQAQMLPSQRQYTCELCGKPFKHPSNLELHKRSHTGTLIQYPQAKGKERMQTIRHHCLLLLSLPAQCASAGRAPCRENVLSQATPGSCSTVADFKNV